MSWKTGLLLHAPEDAIRERARGLKQYLDEVSRAARQSPVHSLAPANGN